MSCSVHPTVKNTNVINLMYNRVWQHSLTFILVTENHVGLSNVLHSLSELNCSFSADQITDLLVPLATLKMTACTFSDWQWQWSQEKLGTKHISQYQRWRDVMNNNLNSSIVWEHTQQRKTKWSRVSAADLPLGACGELGSCLAWDFGLLLLRLGLVPLLRARLLRWSCLPLLGIRASPTGVGAIVRPRLHLTGHADTAHTHPKTHTQLETRDSFKLVFI